MGRRISAQDFDLFHTPHFVLPFGIKIPSIITIHDLIHLSHPEKNYYPLICGALIKSALRRATRVLTVSKSTLSEIKKLCGSDYQVSERLRLVPNALEPSFKKISLDVDKVLTEARLEQDLYFLVVSSMSKPHKGVKDAIEAFRLLTSGDSQYFKIKLALLGKGSEGIERDANCKDIVFLGEVNQKELASLYSGAFALLVPSKAEGFCLPVLEAKALGVTVVSRPVPAIMELLDDSDYLCSNFSIAAMVEALKACLSQREPGSKRQSSHRNFDYSKFSVNKIGSSVLDVYKEALPQDLKGTEDVCLFEGSST